MGPAPPHRWCCRAALRITEVLRPELLLRFLSPGAWGPPKPISYAGLHESTRNPSEVPTGWETSVRKSVVNCQKLQHSTGANELERLCDLGASELLMPITEFQKAADGN